MVATFGMVAFVVASQADHQQHSPLRLSSFSGQKTSSSPVNTGIPIFSFIDIEEETPTPPTASALCSRQSFPYRTYRATMTPPANTFEPASPVAPAHPLTFVHNEKGLFVISLETGEILDQQLSLSCDEGKVYSRKIDKYVGIDTRFPAHSRDAAELVEATAVHDPFIRNLDIHHEALLDLLQHSINATELQVFRYICSSLTAWNYWHGSRKELADQLPKLSKSSLYAILQKLEQGLISNISKGSRSSLLLQVHPWYAFRGAAYIRDGLLEQWTQRQARAASLKLLNPDAA